MQSSPVVVAEVIYVGSEGGFLYSLNRSSGTERWSTNLGKVSGTPTWTGLGTVYVGGDTSVFAVDAVRGAVRWEFETGGAVTASPAVLQNVVIVGSGDHFLYAIEAGTGFRRWSFETTAEITADAIVVGRFIFVGGVDGRFYALTEQSD